VSAAAAGNAVKQAPPTSAAVAQLEAAVTQAEVALADARRTLAETVLRAPVTGTVASVSGVVGETVSGGGNASASSTSSASSASGASGAGSGSSGNGSSSSSGLVTLVNVSDMEATAAFAESDAAKIAVGDAATVTVPALTNVELPARVVSVDEISTTSSSVVQYDVTVALDRHDRRLKPGMTANVSVTTAERDDVLNVPSSAVTGSGANATVAVVGKNGVQRRVRVVAGLQGDTATEIVSGLRKGQTVVTSTGSTLLSGASTSTTTGGFTGRGLGGGLGGLGGGNVRVGVP